MCFIKFLKIYVEITHNHQVFVLTQSFTDYIIYFFKEFFNISQCWRSIYTKTNQLFLRNCELRTDTLQLNSYSFADKALPNKFNKTTSMFMSISFVLSSYPLSLHWAFGKLSSDPVLLITKFSRGKYSEFQLN